MAKEYIVPEWGAMPTHDGFYLEVMKEGRIIDKIDLSLEYFNNHKKSFIIFGRHAEIVDIHLEHESISRQHAILQFRQDDSALMLYDFHSSQGTYLNNKLILSNTYNRVYVGDMIKFGTSTRFYIVCGPENHMLPEYDSVNTQLIREKLMKRNEEYKKKKEEINNIGISWGFDEDADEEIDDNDENNEEDEETGPKKKKLPSYLMDDENYDRKYGKTYNINLDILDIQPNDKDHKLIEKLKKHEKKIQNM